MKITKQQLKQIIKEELEAMNELQTVPSRWWEYDPKDVMADIYHQQRQIPPTDPKKWEQEWQHLKKQLERKYPQK